MRRSLRVSPRRETRDRLPQAALQRILRDRPCPLSPRAEDRAGHCRRCQNQRLHSRDGTGRIRQRLCGRGAARGDELQSPSPRRGFARGHPALFRRGRAARTRARDAGMSIVVTGYAGLDYAVRLELAAAAGPDRDHSVTRPGVAASRRLPGLCGGRTRRRRSAGRRAGQLGGRRRRRRDLSQSTAGARCPYRWHLHRTRPNASMHSRLSAGWALLLSLRPRTDGVGSSGRRPTRPAARGGGDLRHRGPNEGDLGDASSGAPRRDVGCGR